MSRSSLCLGSLKRSIHEGGELGLAGGGLLLACVADWVLRGPRRRPGRELARGGGGANAGCAGAHGRDRLLRFGRVGPCASGGGGWSRFVLGLGIFVRWNAVLTPVSGGGGIGGEPVHGGRESDGQSR